MERLPGSALCQYQGGMTNILLVFIGGGLGAVIRHLVGQAFMQTLGPGFPWHTLTINITGSAIMGLFVGYMARFGSGGPEIRLLVATGILGGYTTFSSFSLDAITLYERGDLTAAALYVIGSVVLSLTAIFAALGVMRSFA